jgi:xanthine dehydrogenase accessory factor
MFDLDALGRAVARKGRVARVVIAAHDGSAPRETGTAMLVWAGGQEGTIGGGALEWEALAQARALLALDGAGAGARLSRMPLGPALGQCCGGAVTLLTEVFDAARMPRPAAGVFARATDGTADGTTDSTADGRAMPLAVRRLLDRARAQGVIPAPQLTQGWFIEPLARPRRMLWIWGAGHVGRALVQVLAPLPDLEITWIDVAQDRFPAQIPDRVCRLVAADPAPLVARAPAEGEHLILTYSHALDLELCHRLLLRGFRRCGLIGSATKWARFRSRLGSLGHAAQAISRIDCPIGEPGLGKHPQAIAIGVAGAFLRPAAARDLRQENAR